MPQATQLYIDRESGSVVLRSQALLQAAPWQTTQEIVGRLLASKCVDSVLLDRSAGTATIRIAKSDLAGSGQTSNTAVELKEIARSLRDETFTNSCVSDHYKSCRNFSFQKTVAGMAAATIIHSLRGRIRLRHPLVRRDPDLASRIESRLARIPGVLSVSASATTGSVVIQYDQLTGLANTLPAALERAICAPHDESNLPVGPSVITWIGSGSCLALATASTFIVPGLAPVTAAALVAFNLKTLGRGIGELCTFRWQISSLYTVIMGTTLITGQFLAAALMQACMAGWHGWSSHRLRKIIYQLRNNADFAFLPGEVEHDIAPPEAQHSRIGNMLTVSAGMILPCDGIVIDGDGELDEQCVRGLNEVTHRAIGDQVFAGCTLLRGQIRVQVTAVGNDTRSSKVRRTLLDSIQGLPVSGGPTERSASAGSRFVPFTFAAGTAALAVGDFTTLAAVLRPDFTTGASISERFGTLSQIGHLLNQGWLVKDSNTLHSLAVIDVVVIARVHQPATLGMSGTSADIASQPTSPQLKRHRLTLFSRTIEIHEIESDEAFCVNYARQLGDSQQRVAVVGKGSMLNQLAGCNLIRVSLTPDDSFEKQSADVVALHAEHQRVEELLHVLHESKRPSEHAWAAVIACNALAISGAFVVGLTGLHVVVLTNLGVLAAGALYDRHFRRAGQMLSSRVPAERPYSWNEVDVESENVMATPTDAPNANEVERELPVSPIQSEDSSFKGRNLVEGRWPQRINTIDLPADISLAVAASST